MAIVSFWSNSEKETGQTLSSIAVATNMAIQHNYRILIISTGFQEKTLEKSFWSEPKKSLTASMFGLKQQPGLNSGIEGLVKIIQSNRTSPNIVADYARVVFKNRLDVLLSPSTSNISAYNEITKYYADLIKVANKDYNLIFIDIDKRMNENDKKAILQASDMVVLTMKQSMESLNAFLKLKEKNDVLKNEILLIGKYDRYSKYNIKNITRYLRADTYISAIDYNTLFNEASEEGKVADFFLKYRSIKDKNDRNVIFIQETDVTCENILAKLKSLQVRT